MGSDGQAGAGTAHSKSFVGPPFIGLTGAVASGKSAALDAFGRLGAATLSADAVVHELLTESEVVASVTGRFGEQVAPGGAIDRDALAKVVFGDDEARKWLEEKVWPLVGLRIWEWRTAQAEAVPPPRAIVVEVPLLFESGMDQAFDATVTVVSDQSVRAARAAARGHVAVEERAGRQLSQDEKAARADHVVNNDGTLDDLQDALAALLARITGDGETQQHEAP